MPKATSTLRGQCYGQVIQAFRGFRGLTVIAMADRLKLTERELLSIEEGENDPTSAELRAITVILRVPLAFLRFLAKRLYRDTELQEIVSLGLSICRSFEEVIKILDAEIAQS